MALHIYEKKIFFRVFSLFRIFFAFPAVGADAFDDVFRFFGDEAVGKGNGRYGYVGEAEGFVADVAGEVDVAAALAGVVVVADAVFLRAAAVVDIVEQEIGRASCRERVFDIVVPSSTLWSRWASLNIVSVRNSVDLSTVGIASSRSLRLKTPLVEWRTCRHIMRRTAVTRTPAFLSVSSSVTGLV